MSYRAYVAFDLGAESGRAMLARLHGQRLNLTEVHRFANTPRWLPSGLHWGLQELWGNLQVGLKNAVEHAAREKTPLVSLGVDTWGVDFALVGRSGQLLGLPFTYRDPRTGPAIKTVLRKMKADRLYAATGVPPMSINTLFQMVAQHKAEPALLDQTRRMLLMPDLLHYFFSGRQVNEATIASTTQMVNPRTGKWHRPLLKDLGLPSHYLKEITPAGTPIGELRSALADELGITKAIQVIVPGSHDTASAVAAVPVNERRQGRWAYLSSGTWSLIGVELDKPILTEKARLAGFTHERGVGGRIRFLRNIAGLWLVQECRRDMARQGKDYTYAQLTELAAQATPFRTLLDTQHAPFALPGGMLAKIDAYADATGQPRPDSPGAYVRACLESLALAYRQSFDALQDVTGQAIDRLHIVGGGGQNTLLNQMTADALGVEVIVGPYEATAIGNALTQAMGAGHVRDLAHLRRIVAASFEVRTYQQKQAAAWDAQASRFHDLGQRTIKA